MTEYDNTNTIAIFRNDKGGNPKRPDYRATINIDGVEYKAPLWVRESKRDGTKFLSGPIELAEDKVNQRAPNDPIELDADSEMPF